MIWLLGQRVVVRTRELLHCAVYRLGLFLLAGTVCWRNYCSELFMPCDHEAKHIPLPTPCRALTLFSSTESPARPNKLLLLKGWQPDSYQVYHTKPSHIINTCFAHILVTPMTSRTLPLVSLPDSPAPYNSRAVLAQLRGLIQHFSILLGGTLIKSSSFPTPFFRF